LAALRRADHAALRFLRTRLHGPSTERAAIVVAWAGEMGAVWIVLALAAAGIDGERRRQWLGVAAVVPVALGANFCVKALTRRARPDLPGLPGLGRVPATGSLPSGHAATAFAAASAAAGVRPAVAPPAYAGATLVALTRPYLGVHYPSDVIAGAALGVLVGRAGRALWGRP
jgi:undecaprenyl-diphosphatase